jgi:LysM repeat protein
MSTKLSPRHLPVIALLFLLSSLAVPAPGPLPLARSLTGSYRKLMEIEDQIQRAAERYEVSPVLARALCLYESGANEGLTSHAGAQGYFQVMPGTFRRLGVATNIQAGVKYLGEQVRRFGREDLALAAYNGGPGVVVRGGRAPLETLQYVLGVGNYKNVLLQHEPELRSRAQELLLLRTEEGDSWWSLSRRTGIPLLELRLYNPFLALRPLRPGQLIAYPGQAGPPPVEFRGGSLLYTVRPGDQYLLVAAALGVAPDRIRDVNGLWHVDLALPGTVLEIPLDREGAEWEEHVVATGESVGDVADRYGVPVWDVIRDNGLWSQEVAETAVVRVDLSRRIPRYASYEVRRGDTLTAIAQRHAVALDSLRQANGFAPNHWRIRVGEVLRIPLG